MDYDGKHLHPIHMNRGSKSHLWACLACGERIGRGQDLSAEDVRLLCEQVKILTEERSEKRADAQTKEEETMKLEMSIMAGPESKAFLVELTQVIARLEQLEALLKVQKLAPVQLATDSVSVASVSAAPVAVESDDDFMAPPKKTAPAPTIEDDFMAPPKPKAEKAKKVTLAEVNDACRARASGGKRDEVLAILQKNFKTESISELKPDQYAQALALMKG